VTEPDTSTASPTFTVGDAEPVWTNTPSLVRGSSSASGSWIQKPREPVVRTPVTTPGTRVTVRPAYGDRRVVPWMSCTRTSPGSAGSCGSVGSSSPPEPGPSPRELTGVGAPAVKSAALSSVSTRESARATDAELDAPAAGPLPSRTTAEP
jgi:hypothetical protein